MASGRIENLDAAAKMARAVKTETAAAAAAIAKDAIELQCSSISAGLTPGGSSQRPVAESTAKLKTKAGKPPLVRTGRLSDRSAWRVETIGGKTIVRPPIDRESAVEDLLTQGWRLIFNDRDGLDKAAAKEVEAAAKRIEQAAEK